MKYRYWSVKNVSIGLMICLFGIAAYAVDGEESKQPAPSDLVQKIQRLMDELGLRITYGTATSSSGLLGLGNNKDLSDGMALFRYEKSLVEVLKALKASGQNEVVMDCQLFVQIAAYIQEGKEHDEKFFLTMGRVHVETMKGPRSANFSYVTVKNEDAQSLLQKTILSSKGQWVIEDQGGWTGLMEDSSMATLSEQDWIKIHKQRFEEEFLSFQYKSNLDPYQQILFTQISISMAKGDFAEWIFSKSGYVSNKARQGLLMAAPMMVASWGKISDIKPAGPVAANFPLNLDVALDSNKDPTRVQRRQSDEVQGYWANSDGGALYIAPQRQISPSVSAGRQGQSQGRRPAGVDDDNQLATDFLEEQILLLKLIENERAANSDRSQR